MNSLCVQPGRDSGLVVEARVVVVALLVVQATGSIYACFLQLAGNDFEFGTRHEANVEQSVAVFAVEHFHDVREVLLACKVKVYFP